MIPLPFETFHCLVYPIACAEDLKGHKSSTSSALTYQLDLCRSIPVCNPSCSSKFPFCGCVYRYCCCMIIYFFGCSQSMTSWDFCLISSHDSASANKLFSPAMCFTAGVNPSNSSLHLIILWFGKFALNNFKWSVLMVNYFLLLTNPCLCCIQFSSIETERFSIMNK